MRREMRHHRGRRRRRRQPVRAERVMCRDVVMLNDAWGGTGARVEMGWPATGLSPARGATSACHQLVSHECFLDQCMHATSGGARTLNHGGLTEQSK